MKANQFGHTNEEYIRVIKKTLSEKYNQNFSVESLGGSYGTEDDATIKAWCFCTEGAYKNIKFLTKIGKENLLVSDKYLSLKAADLLSIKIKSTLHGNPSVFSEVGIDYSNFSAKLTIENVEPFLLDNGCRTASAYIFISDDTLTAERVIETADKLADINVNTLLVIICLVKNPSYNYRDLCVSAASDKRYDTVLANPEVMRHCSFTINDHRLVTSHEKIKVEIGE